MPLSRTSGMADRLFNREFTILWIVTLFNMMSFNLLSAGLPLYAVMLGADDLAVGLLTTMNAGVSVLTRPWIGWWLDRGGAVSALILGAGIFAACALGYWLAGAVLVSVVALLGFRAINGMGMASFSTSGQTLATNLAPPARRGESLGIYALSQTVAQGVGPPVGVAVAQTFSYPALFVVCSACSLIAIALGWTLRRRQVKPAVVARRKLFNQAVRDTGLLMLAVMFAFGITTALLSVHASRRGVANPGLALTAFAAGLVLAQLITGRLSDRFGRISVIAPSMLITALGMGAIAASSAGVLLGAAAITGFGLGAVQASLYALASEQVPLVEWGSAMATVGIFLEAGIASGALVGGLIGRLAGLGPAFAVAGLAPLIGMVLAIWFDRTGRTATLGTDDRT